MTTIKKEWREYIRINILNKMNDQTLRKKSTASTIKIWRE
jgi:hypothetical protein